MKAAPDLPAGRGLARLWARWRRGGEARLHGLPHIDEQVYRLLEQSGSGLLSCRRDGTVRSCSKVAARLLGTTAQQVVGQPVSRWFDGPVDLAGLLVPGQRELLARRCDGSAFPAELTVSDAWHGPGGLFLLMLRDITERSEAQHRLSQLANFDSLTGLPNRAHFRQRLARAMERSQRLGRPMALMFLDLDRFKLVNDSLGHEVGDRLLKHVAGTLCECLGLGPSDGAPGRRANDAFTVSRLGGDEFTVIAQDVGGADEVAVIARRILDALDSPFRAGDTELQVSASLGISVYPADPVDLDGLVRHTDMAMYRAKLGGRGTYCFYSAEMSAEVAARVSLESDLRRALERGEFVLHYQPKVRLSTREVTGVEALLRWHCPGRGLVPPDRFIGVLEESGLILPVGAWVIRSACAELAGWDRAGLPPLHVAVNLSARQFRQPYLARLVLDTLRDHGLAPQRLEIELTESLLLSDDDATRGALRTLADMGVRVAMDDFGTGHSSMSYLKRFDIDTLKIDRSFISELPDDAEDAAISAAIVAMGRTLQMKTVAEGVETEPQARYLHALGCDEIQGYLVSRPLAGPQFVNWLREQQLARRRRSRPRPYTDTHPMTLMTMDTLGNP
jgi:diguanylate cyclase (GGDEF)-like protein/PAS domain S-box-containing protein